MQLSKGRQIEIVRQNQELKKKNTGEGQAISK